ncbi:MAG: aldo/keto reductase [Candidatus Saccharicenans sp.]|nr:aldo/keto reductase [Candidatus Saccharicenans sp.]
MKRKDFLKLAFGGLVGVRLGDIAKEVSSHGINPHHNYQKDKAQTEQTESYNTALAKKLPRFTELGKTGIRVSTIGFGVSRTMEPALVEAVVEAGINFMDTGRSYFRGQNEIMLGKAVAGKRKEIVIQSKLRVNLSVDRLNSKEDISRAVKEMEQSLQASLKALGTDYLDLLLIHGAEEPAIIHHQEIMRFFEEQKRKGLIRADGFSCHLNQVRLLQEENRVRFYDVIMTTYNHGGYYVHMNTGRRSSWDQVALEREMRQARERGVGLVAMKTCSAGPFAPASDIKPSYARALKWILERNVVHTMAVAMASFEQIRENLLAWQ